MLEGMVNGIMDIPLVVYAHAINISNITRQVDGLMLQLRNVFILVNIPVKPLVQNETTTPDVEIT